MKKKYIYDVAGWLFWDIEAFGGGWKAAKAKATILHCAIYRTVYNGETERREVFFKGGCFNNVKYATSENVMIF